MKMISLKTVVVGLGCILAINASALPVPAQESLFNHLPLYFTAAPGGTHPEQFVANGLDCQFLISAAGARIELQKIDATTKNASRQTVRMQFVGADSRAQIQGTDELPGKVNYLIGRDPAHWNTGIATFGRLQVERLYPGVNQVYYGNQRKLEYDLTVAPNANPDSIQIRFDGVDRISIGSEGELVLTVGGSRICQQAPVIYQTVHGQRQFVHGGYCLLDAHTVGFKVDKYHQGVPLVIDPVLNFSTYFGGNSDDIARSVALDKNGFIYLAGNTLSSQFPTNSRPNGYQTNFTGGGTGDAFVAKFDNQGSNLIYFTYVGGDSDDQANSIAVDGTGAAFITGFTDSPNFPTTTNALYRSISGTPTPAGYFVDAFVAELGPSGSNLVYSTYLGGSGPDAGAGIALDSSNNIYIVGYSGSTNLPTSSNAFQKHLACPFSIYTTYLYANAFVAEISISETNLLYCSYLGGTNLDIGKSIAIDASNNVYIAGFTASTNFPTTNYVFQQFLQTNTVGTNEVVVTNVFNGSLLNGSTQPTTENQSTPNDAFVAEFSPGCTNLIYSTLLGGTNNDVANGIAVDNAGNAYVTGWTVSTNFPNNVAVSNLYNGLATDIAYGYGITTNVFLTQVTWNGTNAAIGFSSVFGGTNVNGGDVGNGITLDPYGNIYIVGSSTSTNFPAVNTPGLLGATNAGASDVFVIAFAPNMSSVLYSGYLGGAGNDYGYGITADSATNVYIVGQTASTKFPTFNARQTTLNGSSDAFLAKIGWTNEPPQITTQPTNQDVATGTSVSLVAAATGTAPLSFQWQELGTNSAWTNVVNKGNISGATNATLTISNAQTTNSGTYRLFVANTAGSTTSSNAVLTVTNAFPTITTQPTNQTVGVGGGSAGYATFSATVSGGTPPVAYQWVKDDIKLVNGGTNAPGAAYPFHIYGATNTALYVVDPQTNDAGRYWLVITNPAGVLTSSIVTLTVTEAPVITAPPTNQTVGLGSRVSFAATAIGSSPLSYQWQFDGANLTDGPKIGGATNATLILTNAQTSDSGNYVVIVTNAFGSATSAPPAVLTVLAAPTFMNVIAGTNGSIVLSGTGGTNGATYYVYASTNLATPLNQWTPIQVNGSQFGNQGQFIFTNTPPANTPQRFYLLEVPSQ